MVWGVLGILVIDRIIKQYALVSDTLKTTFINPDFLFFTIDQSAAQILSLLILGIIICIAVAYLRSLSVRARENLYAPLILIVGGGISNSIDRFVYGGVVDIFSLPGFTVFNLADVALVSGAALLAYTLWHQQFIPAR